MIEWRLRRIEEARSEPTVVWPRPLSIDHVAYPGVRMARQNYGFNKRQRELAKRQKKEEKAARRQERKDAGITEVVVGVDEYGNPIFADVGPDGLPITDAEAGESDGDEAAVAAGVGADGPDAASES